MEKPPSPSPENNDFSRRHFLRSSAFAGAATGLASCTKTNKDGEKVIYTRDAIRPAWQGHAPQRDLQIAIVGCGAQGEALYKAIDRIDDAKMLPHIRAVVDIDNTRVHALSLNVKKTGHAGTEYKNIEELLEKEGKHLDAVILAVPDSIHHELTIKALKAGLHVYCEKMMSNRIEWAREMVHASRETGKLLQIGHQRRSNPRYIALRNEIIGKHHGLGRMTHAYAQWHRGVKSSRPEKIGESPKKVKLAKEYGYASADEMRNWRHFRKYGGGIISDLGAHQIDLFNWFYQARPKRVVAMGDVDYWTEDNKRGHYELPDNVMAMYEYEIPGTVSPDGKPHTARGYYQTLTTTGNGGFHERFMGDAATVSMSEVPKWNQIYRETHTEDAKHYPEYCAAWNKMLEEELIYPIPSDKYWKGRRVWESRQPFGRKPPSWFETPKDEDDAQRAGYVDVRVSDEPPAYGLGTTLTTPAHQPHLLNFFAAVEANDKSMLNCPGETAFETTVTVLKIYDALAHGGQAEFRPEDFVI